MLGVCVLLLAFDFSDMLTFQNAKNKKIHACSSNFPACSLFKMLNDGDAEIQKDTKRTLKGVFEFPKDRW